jgi:hypothetical protein
VASAIADALQEFCIHDLRLPATPQALWRAMQDARQSKQP